MKIEKASNLGIHIKFSARTDSFSVIRMDDADAPRRPDALSPERKAILREVIERSHSQHEKNVRRRWRVAGWGTTAAAYVAVAFAIPEYPAPFQVLSYLAGPSATLFGMLTVALLPALIGEIPAAKREITNESKSQAASMALFADARLSNHLELREQGRQDSLRQWIKAIQIAGGRDRMFAKQSEPASGRLLALPLETPVPAG